MNRIASSIATLVFAACGFGVMAETSLKPPPITPASAQAEAAGCPDSSDTCKLICKKFDPPTGTRLGGRTECRTQHWWDDRMREDQATIAKIQENSYKQVRPGE